MFFEAFDCAEMFENFIESSQNLREILRKLLPVQFLTDIKIIFDLISKALRISENCTILDIASAQKVFKDCIISYMCFVRSQSNLADWLNKFMAQEAIYNAVSSGFINQKMKQLIHWKK